MKAWIIVGGIIFIIAVIFIIRVRYELVTLQRTDYTIFTDKIASGQKIKLAVISDLHNRTYGKDNCRLIEMIKETKPDCILAVGDLVTASRNKPIGPVLNLLSELSAIAPLYYSPGNHEKRILVKKESFPKMGEELKEGLQKIGVEFLDNKSILLNDRLSISGLDIDYRFYNKLKVEKYMLSDIQKDLPEKDDDRFNILMAHSPKFFSTYAAAGYDLVLSGHYHGGGIQLPGIGGVISPQFVLFPKYSKGKYVQEKTTMIVSSGCGSHKVNLRLFNKPEVMVVEINGY